MFFVASKLFWTLAQPVSIIMLLLIVTVLALFLKRRRIALTSAMTAGIVLFLLAYTSTGVLLIQPLEDRFSRPAVMPGSVSSIIVLGGATDSKVSGARQVTELRDAADRMTEAAALARHYPAAPIVFSGGIGALEPDPLSETEAASAERFFLAQGVRADRLVLEAQARNTAENADYIKALLPADAAPALLVTSAFHMPRSVGLFRKAGIEVIPWPVDFRSTGWAGPGLDVTDPASNLATATTAIREWVGLAAYRAAGRIDTLLPGP